MEDNLVKTVELAVMRVMKFMILLEPLGNKYIRSHEKGNFIKNVISLGNVLFLFSGLLFRTSHKLEHMKLHSCQVSGIFNFHISINKD